MSEQPVVEPRPRDKVDGALDAIDQIYAAGALGDDSYHKCLVSLSYEYLLVDELDFALVLLNRCPEEYYKGVQLRQMEEDAMYKDLVILLAYKLIQMGAIEGSEGLYLPTQAKASA